MSSYLTFYLINKKEFEEYETKLKKIREDEKDKQGFMYWSKAEDELYHELRKSCIVSMSRSNPIYVKWGDEFGYNNDLKPFDEARAKDVLETMKKRLSELQGELKLFEETGVFSENDENFTEIEKCIKFIKSKQDSLNKDDVNYHNDFEMYKKVVKVLRGASLREEDSEWKFEVYEEVKETIEEYKFSISALETVLNVYGFNDYGDEALYWLND